MEQIKLASPLSEVLKAEGLLLDNWCSTGIATFRTDFRDLRGITCIYSINAKTRGGVLIGLSAGWLLSEILKK